MFTRNANGCALVGETENLTEQRDGDDGYTEMLWAIVGQAVEDSTRRGIGRCECDRGCPWSPDEAYGWLKKMFGPEHRIVRGVTTLRAEGRRIHVNLHYQDHRDGEWQARDTEGRWR